MTTPSNEAYSQTAGGASGTAVQLLVPSTTPSLPAPELSGPSQSTVVTKGVGVGEGGHKGNKVGQVCPLQFAQVGRYRSIQVSRWALGENSAKTPLTTGPQVGPCPGPCYPIQVLSWPGAVPTY